MEKYSERILDLILTYEPESEEAQMVKMGLSVEVLENGPRDL